MKSNQGRYDGAVARNLGNAEKRAEAPTGNPYKGLDLKAAKLKLGIRKYDDQFDARVGALILAGKKAGAK